MQQYVVSFMIGLFFLYCPFAKAQKAQAAFEQISNYDSTIIVNKNASLDITEIITVTANQHRVRHGIVRWLPSNFLDSHGVKHQTLYHIQQILLNGHAVPYSMIKQKDQFVVTIGDRNSALPSGQYIYTLRYHVKNGINFLKNWDELYWNVTSNSWDFPITKTVATIQLPPEAQINQYTAYTGKLAAQSKNYLVTRPASNQIQFITTQPLSRSQGLTVIVGWPKGIVHKPIVANFVPQLAPLSDQTLAIEITAILIIYYLVIWGLYGRGLRTHVITPVYEPPLNLSPASMRFIYRMGFDLKVFTAAIVSMATKQYLTIEEENSIVTLIKTGMGLKLLSEDEKEIACILFADKTSIDITSKEGFPILNAKTTLKQFLIKKFQNVYFMTNTLYLIPGWCFGFISLFTIIHAVGNNLQAQQSLVWVAFGTMIGIAIFYKAIQAIRLVFWTPSLMSVSRAVILCSIALVFIWLGTFVFAKLYQSVPQVLILLFILSVIINILFFYLMKAPTSAGRKLYNQIKGFKLTLSSFHPMKEKTSALFVKFLPYAIALDVENEWENQFSDALTKANPVQPQWYSGRRFSLLHHFTKRLNGILCSAVLLSTDSKSVSLRKSSPANQDG